MVREDGLPWHEYNFVGLATVVSLVNEVKDAEARLRVAEGAKESIELFRLDLLCCDDLILLDFKGDELETVFSIDKKQVTRAYWRGKAI